MYLSRAEEAILNGEKGQAPQYAMKILTKYGDATQAEKMVPITSAHVSVTSFKHVKDVGLEWLEKLVSMHPLITVPTTTQATGVDLKRWDELSFSETQFLHQKKICDCHLAMGNAGTFTCAPYLLGHCPTKGSHMVSVESSCIPYMNSVFGARTNRECGQSALLAAIIGHTPNFGLHQTPNRKGDLLVKVEAELKTELDFSLLGFYVGAIAGHRTPVYDKLPVTNPVQLRAMGAAMATSGAVRMWHCPGVSAEARSLDEAFQGDTPEEIISFTKEDYKQTLAELNDGVDEKVDVIDLGCPHYSTTDVLYVARLLEGKKIHPSVEFTVWTSQAARNVLENTGAVQIIEAAGGHVYTDSCPIASLLHFRDKAIATNSAKQAGNAPSILGGPVHTGTLKQCINAAFTGYWK